MEFGLLFKRILILSVIAMITIIIFSIILFTYLTITYVSSDYFSDNKKTIEKVNSIISFCPTELNIDKNYIECIGIFKVDCRITPCIVEQKEIRKPPTITKENMTELRKLLYFKYNESD